MIFFTFYIPYFSVTLYGVYSKGIKIEVIFTKTNEWTINYIQMNPLNVQNTNYNNLFTGRSTCDTFLWDVKLHYHISFNAQISWDVFSISETRKSEKKLGSLVSMVYDALS